MLGRARRFAGRLRPPPRVRGLTRVVGGLDFGEGPRWHDDRLWYSDFHQHTVSAVTEGGTPEVMVTLDGQPSGLGWLPDGRLLLVSMLDHRVLRREHDGTLVVHADLSDLATGPCNDMVVATDGTAYVGNFGSDLEAGEPVAFADLVRVSPTGDVSVAATRLSFPNGSVIFPDEETLVVGETFGHRFTAFTIQPDGTLADRRLWASVGDVSPDGCALDADGGIWVADATAGDRRHPGSVVRVVEGGEITDRVATPHTAYACALGGRDGTTLFVVTAPSTRHQVSGRGKGAIWSRRVDVPHAGRP